MFSWFKKRQEETTEHEAVERESEKYELALEAEAIPVANLKQHIVDGYELERKLKKELEEVSLKLVDKENELIEMESKYEVIQVVADKSSSDFGELQIKYNREITDHKQTKDILERNKNRLTEEVNTLKIKLKKYEDMGEVLTEEESNQQYIQRIKIFENKIESLIYDQKGNLSKKGVIKLINGVIKIETENYENNNK